MPEQVVDRVDVLLGDGLELLLGAGDLVLADLAVLDELSSSSLAWRRMLRTETRASSALLLRQLDVLAAALLGELRA